MTSALRQRGFTILETLVAFIIFAAASVVLFRAVGTGLRATAVTGHTIDAWQRAQSRLAAQSFAVRPGDSAGDDGGGFGWRTEIRQIDAADRLRLFAISVTITWRMDGGERRVQLTSDRLAVVAEPQ